MNILKEFGIRILKKVAIIKMKFKIRGENIKEEIKYEKYEMGCKNNS